MHHLAHLIILIIFDIFCFFFCHLDWGGDAFVTALHHVDDVRSIRLQHGYVRLARDLAEDGEGFEEKEVRCAFISKSAPCERLVRCLIVLLDSKHNIEVAFLDRGQPIIQADLQTSSRDFIFKGFTPLYRPTKWGQTWATLLICETLG